MTITCAHCGSDSRVVESRQRAFVQKHGRVNINIVRLRECLACRWRWKTVERTLPKIRIVKCPSPPASTHTPTASISSKES